MELQEAFADYRYYLQMNAHKSPRTIVSYSHDLNDYLTYLQELGIHAAEEVRECDVQDYLIGMSEEFRRACAAALASLSQRRADQDDLEQLWRQ